MFKEYIRDIPNFPIPGVTFRDVSPLLADAKIFNLALEKLAEQIDLNAVDLIAGVEARGFIFASAFAIKYGKGFLPIRKAGKLPPPTLKKKYSLEYGNAEIEVFPGTGRVLILDDVLATGGTLQACADLMNQAGYKVTALATLIDLRFLNDMKFEGKSVISAVVYE